MKIHFGSFVRSGTAAAVIAGLLYLVALTPFFNSVISVLMLTGIVLIPLGAGLYYGYLAPGEESIGQSVIGGALSGFVAGIILGIAFGINAFMLAGVTTGLLGTAIRSSIGVTIVVALVAGIFAAIVGAIGGVIWKFVQN